MRGGCPESAKRSWSVGVAVVVLILGIGWAGSVAAQALPWNPSLTRALDDALDRGDGPVFLDLIAEAVTTVPDDAVRVAALAGRLAPWMGDSIVTRTLTALPKAARAEAGPPVLLAVLGAGAGRQAPQVVEAAAVAVPDLDADRLATLAEELSRAGGDDLLLAEVLARQGDGQTLGAIRAAREGLLIGRQAAGTLAPARRSLERQAEEGPERPQGYGLPVHLEARPDRFLLPRLPDPGQRPSPS